MKEEYLKSLGQSGVVVCLVKKLIKPGKKSSIKPGNKREIILHKPLAVGHPAVERLFSTRSRTEGIPKGYQKTSTILSIRFISEEFLVETDTSIYSVIIL